MTLVKTGHPSSCCCSFAVRHCMDKLQMKHMLMLDVTKMEK